MPRGTDIHGRPPLLWRALEGGEVRGRDWEERIEGELRSGYRANKLILKRRKVKQTSKQTKNRSTPYLVRNCSMYLSHPWNRMALVKV